jgi:uncharacterized protein YbjT (DUF2867 family)
MVFGASGMIGGGVLRECLEDPRVTSVLCVGRRSSGLAHPKLDELIRSDLFDLAPVAQRLEGYDACFYCVGVSSAGTSEEAYRRITLGLTVSVAAVLERASPGIVVCFVSGLGSDGTGTSRVMWARVKGEAENSLLEGTLDAYVLRPGFVQPMKGVRSATPLYRALYGVAGPLFPVLRRLFPASVTTTATVGRAMLRIASGGWPKRVLETRDINEAGAPPS